MIASVSLARCASERPSARIPQYGSTALSRNAPVCVRLSTGCRKWDGIGVGHDRGVLDRNLLLICVERADQVEAGTLLDIEHSNSGETTGSTFARLGTHEGRGHRQLVADDGAIDRQMVPVELESPRRVRRRHTEEGHEIWPFAVIIRPAGHLSEQVVESHDVASLRIATSRQRDAEQVEECIPLNGRQFLEHDPVPIHVDVWVEPGSAIGQTQTESSSASASVHPANPEIPRPPPESLRSSIACSNPLASWRQLHPS